MGEPPWRWSGRLAFKFYFVFVLLYILPFPFGVFGLLGPVSGWWDAVWEPIVPWVARHVLHLGYEFPRWGGAETTWYHIQIACAGVIALVAAVSWQVFDRRDEKLPVLDQWLRVYLRLFLAAMFFSYGWAKIFPVQFSALGPDRLSETFGEASPHGLLWAFMGYSTQYMAFTGVWEVMAGVLLCLRRTTTLGALLGIGVLSNVLAMNLAFDIGVRLDLTFFIVALGYLAAPDLARLRDVFLLGRAVPVRPTTGFAPGSWAYRLAVIVPGLLAAYFFQDSLREKWRYAHDWGQLSPHPALYGLYDVQSVVKNGVRHSVVPEDSALWSRFALGDARATIRLRSDSLGFYASSVDTLTRRIRLTSREDAGAAFDLGYEPGDSGVLVLRGRLGPDSIEMQLRRRDHARYRLVNHRFHWIHDTNENR